METKQNNSLTAHGLIKLDYYNEESKHYIQFTQGNFEKTTEGIQIFVPNDSVKYLAFIEYEKFDILFEINNSGEVTNKVNVTDIKKESIDKAADPLSYVGSVSMIKEENHNDVADITNLYLDVKSDDGNDDLPLENLSTYDGSEKNDIDLLKTENILRRTDQSNYKDSFDVFTKRRNNYCKICNIRFSSHKETLRHYKTLHSKRSSCSQNVKKICKSSKVFSKESVLIDKTSNKQDEYGKSAKQHCFKCDICDTSYKTALYLKSHRLKHFGKTKHKCDVCSNYFKTLKELKLHVSIHGDGEKKFECEECHKKFHLKSDWNKHRILHVMERPHQCDKCPRRFLSLAKLQSHQLVHTGIKSFECHICHKMFYRSVNLLSHLVIHNEDKKLQCDICGRKFVGKHGFKLHKMTHTNEKPFGCDICKKNFITKLQLTEHYRRHTGEKPYKCDICFEKFAQKQTLRRHFRVNHGDGKPHVCSVCGKSFPILNSLTKHKKIHNENSKKHCCSQCGMRFICNGHLRRHLMVHSGETPYECSQCGKKFTQKSNMRSHMKVHTK